MTSKVRPDNLGDLKSSGWKSRPVREEMRENLASKLTSKEELFPGIIGFDTTVIPQLINAILSKHHFILLGLRGQAKTRIIRQLYTLLDEYQPSISGLYLNEDPYNPISPKGKEMLREHGDKLPITWRHREDRFHEKLATPDVSIADLIGDIDPIKAAREKLDISNEEVIHWGIIPRTNRGIFAINELPDLQPRIQVGLLNILEENDIQVRGFPLRLPLDICMIFSANPEDYTNRGNIITPLKDRIDSQVMTHYPRTRDDAKRITSSEISRDKQSKNEVVVPELLKDIIEEISIQARNSEFVDQSSGVSARVAISAYELLVSNVERRCHSNGESVLHPRLCDLYATVPAISGKIELVYEGEQEGAALVARNLVGKAINQLFVSNFPAPVKGKQSPDEAPIENPYEAVTDYFATGNKIEISDDMSFEEYSKSLKSIAGLKATVSAHFPTKDSHELLLRMELVLEGLFHNNLIAREDCDTIVRYGDVFSDMLKGMGKRD